jgi:hypothetical protein
LLNNVSFKDMPALAFAMANTMVASTASEAQNSASGDARSQTLRG